MSGAKRKQQVYLVLLFSKKHPGCSTTALLLIDFIYSQLSTSSSWSAPPSAQCQLALEDVLLPKPLPTLQLDPPVGSLFPAPVPVPCPHAGTRCSVLLRLVDVCLTNSAKISVP